MGSSPRYSLAALAKALSRLTPGLTFDTGALIALERRRPHVRRLHQTALLEGIPVIVPSVVVAEWWRRGKREKERAQILRTLVVEPTTDHIARLAGVAVGLVGAGVVDAIVMASASVRGGLVYTSDVGDLERLAEVFRNVRVEGI
jgi:predicted nucleic acid-binding protein